MMSNKWTFSLTVLITVFAFAFVATSEVNGLTISLAEITGDSGVTPAIEDITDPPDIDTIKDGHQLRLGVSDPRPLMIKVMTDIVLRGTGTNGALQAADTTDKLVILQTTVDTSTDPDTVETTEVAAESDPAPSRSGAMGFMFTVDPADNTTKLEIHIPAEAFGKNEAMSLMIEFLGTVRLDDPEAPTNTDRPQVVSIQRLRPGSQTVVAAFQEAEVTGAFDVRIVLTEAGVDWKADKVGDRIKVDGGTASALVVGTPFSWFGVAEDATTPREMSNDNRGYAVIPHPSEGMYQHEAEGPLTGVPQGSDGFVPLPTGKDKMYHQYRVTITPHRRATSVTVSVKDFHDGAEPYKNYYQPVMTDEKPNGREQLKLTVNIPKHNLEAGYRIYLPHEEGADFPKDGHYILTRNKDGSFINYSHHEGTDTPDRENKAQEQTVAQLKYNVRETTADTPGARTRTADEPQIDLPNLEAFLANHGTIHLVSYVRDGANPKYKMGDLYISEVMWGTDASQDPVSNSNWIEIRRKGDKIDVGAQDWALWFYEAHETPPTAYPKDSSYEGAIGQPGEIIDIIGTKASDTGLSWSIAGKGQNGRSNIDIARTTAQVLSPTTPLISMYRVMVADTSADAAAGAMVPGDGTLAASWMQTSGPSVNLSPGRENAIIATPGAAPFETPDIVAAEKKAAEDKEKAAQAEKDKVDSTGTYPMAGEGRVYISEVMFAGNGMLPQWIEISNGDVNKEFNLSGWTITVNNAAADTDVSIHSATFKIPDGTMIDPSGQHDTPSTILVVTEEGRTNIDDGPGNMGANQIIVLDDVELIVAGVLTRKYTLLSDEAFLITLAPPKPAATKAPAGETAAAKTLRQANEKKAAANRQAATDMVGNLGKDGAAAWALPMNTEGGRSSIIRQHIQVARGDKAAEDGMMAENWVLASTTSLLHGQSYYGAVTDQGTPGFRAGGALPVELSHFRPARDKATGQVVITWSTQSELNNAGFFIKRSQQKDGEFKVINATMVPGAGTTSEKQFYTYTDTTAQPNVVYYYQIEDVSLDGNHQTLTRGIRLKGHVSVAGKLTSLWGELKSSNE